MYCSGYSGTRGVTRRFCRYVNLPDTGAESARPASISFHDVEGMFDWYNRLERYTLLSVQASDSSRNLAPRTTTDRLWFFLPKCTCKQVDPCTTCDGLQEGWHEQGGLLNAVSPVRNSPRPLSTCWSPWSTSRRATTDYGMHPAASASLKHRNVEDLLSV
jgi:hypothetical protein